MIDKQSFVVIGIEATVNVFTNGLLNALCAWLIYRNAVSVPCDMISIFIDTYITCLAVCLCTTLFAVSAAKRHLKNGELQKKITKKNLFAQLPKQPLFLALLISCITRLPLGLLFGLVFLLCGIVNLPLSGFIIYKGVWGGLYGGLVCAVVLRRYQYADEEVAA